MERASRWTLLTDRLNAVVWHLPVPRGVRVRLGHVVYRNPVMPAERVHETLDALSSAHVEAWCMGGWGVDALLGEQSRDHRDLDLIVDLDDVDWALAALARLGYREWYRNLATAAVWYREDRSGREDEDVVVLRDGAYRAVEVHLLRLRRCGLTPAAGVIAGRTVRCLSAESQRRAYRTYRAHHGREHPNAAIVSQLA